MVTGDSSAASLHPRAQEEGGQRTVGSVSYHISLDYRFVAQIETLSTTYDLNSGRDRMSATAASISAETSFSEAVAFAEPSRRARKKSAARMIGM